VPAKQRSLRVKTMAVCPSSLGLEAM
jgi:hypothetical protein